MYIKRAKALLVLGALTLCKNKSPGKNPRLYKQ